MLVGAISTLNSILNNTTSFLFVFVALISWWYYTSRDLPPGPWGLPLLGYLPYLNDPSPDVVLHKLCKKYGNVIRLKLGTVSVVVLGNYESIKEAFIRQGDNFAGRPSGVILKTTDEEPGVISIDGELWREHRRFMLSTMRDYGMGKLSQEPEILGEIHCFLEEVAGCRGESHDFAPLIGISTANVISAIVFGKRFSYSDLRFAELRRILDRITDLFSSVSLRCFFPNWTRYIPVLRKLSGEEEMSMLSVQIRVFLNEIIDEHKECHVENSRKDYIDAFITEQKRLTEKYGHQGLFGPSEMVSNVLNLFGAGAETTSSTLYWAFFYIAKYPDIQKKMQKEIDEVIGMERAPSLSDRTRMTYTEAVLLEVQRCGSVAPLSLIHSNYEEAWIAGYRIPKRTHIMPNLWAVHQDPTLWKNPELFSPERFIDDDGKLLKIDHLIPFGIGKRACLGEALARMEIFLYVTSTLQRFSLSVPDECPLSDGYEFGVVRRPKPYKLRLNQRSGYHVV